MLARPVAAADGVSSRTVRETVETARALESLPHIAAAAHDGRLSGEQLSSVVELADETTDPKRPAPVATTASGGATCSSGEGSVRVSITCASAIPSAMAWCSRENTTEPPS